MLVAEDGSVENRVDRRRPRACRPRPCVEASNYLNAQRARPHACPRRGRRSRRRGAAARQELDEIAARLVDAGLASWAGVGGIARAAHRARPGQSARRSARGRRSRAHPDAVRRPRDQDGRHRSAASRRDRRGRQDFHRLGEQAVLAVGLVDDRRAVARRATSASPACSASSGRRASITAASCRWSNMPRRCLANSSARASATRSSEARISAMSNMSNVGTAPRIASAEAIERLRGKWAAIAAFGVLLVVLGCRRAVLLAGRDDRTVTLNGVFFLIARRGRDRHRHARARLGPVLPLGDRRRCSIWRSA